MTARANTPTTSRTPTETGASFESPFMIVNDSVGCFQDRSSKNPPSGPNIGGDGTRQTPSGGQTGRSLCFDDSCTTPSQEVIHFSVASLSEKSHIVLMDRELRQRREHNEDKAAKLQFESDDELVGLKLWPSHEERADHSSCNNDGSRRGISFKPRYSVLTSLDDDCAKPSTRSGTVDEDERVPEPSRPYRPWNALGSGPQRDKSPTSDAYRPIDPSLLLSLSSTPSPNGGGCSDQRKQPLPTRFPVVRPQPLKATHALDFDNLVWNRKGHSNANGENPTGAKSEMTDPKASPPSDESVN